MNDDNIKDTNPEVVSTSDTENGSYTAPEAQTASPIDENKAAETVENVKTAETVEGVRAYSSNPDIHTGTYSVNASQYSQNVQQQSQQQQQYQQQQQQYQQQQQQQYQQPQFQPPQYQQPQYQQPQYRQQYGFVPPAAPAPKKKHTGAIIAIIAVAVVLIMIFSLAAFAVGYYVFRGNSKVPADTTPETPVSTEADDVGGETTPVDGDNTPVTDPSVSLSVGNSSTQYSMTDAAAKTVNSIVEIRTEQAATGSFMQQYIMEGAGSGIIITSDGYIATNNHVIDGATSIKVILRDGTQYTATLVGTDEKTDVAVIKIETTGLSPVTFGDSDKLVVAQSVIAIGNPLGELGGSVTNGIISALSRDITVENQAMTLLQTTAAVNPGNSGGGLFNMSGELIGIVNAKSSGEDIEGIGFAIPANTAIPVIEDIVKYGYVKGRVQLGITGVEILDNYTAMQYRVNKLGVYVYSVAENSDADKAGLMAGDLLVKINGEDVKTFQQVKNIIQASSVGETMTVIVERKGEQKTFEIKLTEYKPETILGD